MPQVSFETLSNPPKEIVDAIDTGLAAYNEGFTGKRDWERIAIAVRDENGTLVGGLIGVFGWDWLHVSTLWLDERVRGQDVGTRLLAMAEQEALARGITNVHLETESFQALGFYLKNGYHVFGRLDDKPKGYTWYYLKKEGLK